MATSEARCQNCGTPLKPEDTACPSCGAAVEAASLFPKPEEFVHESYQNVEEPVEPVVEVLEAEVVDIPPVRPQRTSTPPSSTAGMYSPPPAQTSVSGGRNRGCLIACSVTAVVLLCCLVATALVVAFSWNIVVDILNSIGIIF
jgi:hypothetical protein